MYEISFQGILRKSQMKFDTGIARKAVVGFAPALVLGGPSTGFSLRQSLDEKTSPLSLSDKARVQGFKTVKNAENLHKKYCQCQRLHRAIATLARRAGKLPLTLVPVTKKVFCLQIAHQRFF